MHEIPFIRVHVYKRAHLMPSSGDGRHQHRALDAGRHVDGLLLLLRREAGQAAGQGPMGREASPKTDVTKTHVCVTYDGINKT